MSLSNRIIKSNFVFRPKTNDRDIYQQVVDDNEYRLPSKFDKEDVVLDIGAHIGSFSYACLVRGAGRVVAFEPDPENYRALCSNLSSFIQEKRLVVYNKAVYRSDISSTLYLGEYSQVAENVANTGGVGVILQDQGRAVESIGLDQIISDIQLNTRQVLRLLKLDCEGAEWGILMTSKLFHRFEEICGEFHEIGGEYNRENSQFEINGTKNFTNTLLIGILQTAEYSVVCHRSRDLHRNPTSCGLFFASRYSVFSRKYWRYFIRLNCLIKIRLLIDDFGSVVESIRRRFNIFILLWKGNEN